MRAELEGVGLIISGEVLLWGETRVGRRDHPEIEVSVSGQVFNDCEHADWNVNVLLQAELHRFPERILGTEISAGNRPRYHQAVWGVQGGRKISRYRWKRKHPEEIRLGEEDLL